MPAAYSSRFLLTLIANLALAASACTALGGHGNSASDEDDDVALPSRSPKATPVDGPAKGDELTDELGVFVSPRGLASGDGTHDHPLATVQAGIERARAVGKRVYVCTGTFKESLTIADSISVIGGLDCSGETWRTGAPRTRIESPTSPALRASNITSATRIEGLEIFAPDAAAPSASSIGLVADHAPALVVARTKIVAGDGMKGDDGHEGTQLSSAPSAGGAAVPVAAACRDGDGSCTRSGVAFYWTLPPGGAPGLNTCVGAPGHVAQQGGAGGSGGLYVVTSADAFHGSAHFEPYLKGAASNAANDRTSAPGADGIDGASAAATGTFSAAGYVPADGSNGKDGAAGSGGSGGNGAPPFTPSAVGDVWRGWGGAGGGAGGCPGLAGSAGKGGGASIAALLVVSAVTFDGAELVAGRGGSGGLGVFGSKPTAGGAGGYNPRGDLPMLTAKAGGRGGAAGVSTNGGSGPSIGLAHVGAAPILAGATAVSAGAGGDAIASRSRADALGITKTIPATPRGLAAAVFPL